LPDWRDPRAREFAYVHVAPSLQSMSKTYKQAMSGMLPDEPVLVVAQPTVVDPSRAPQGKHVVSIQVRVVPAVMDKEAYADRIIALVERYAPGLRQKILGRHVISPQDLERANPNLVGGDNIAGSHQLGQQYIFRPFFGWWRYRTPVRRLYMCGASTWPGAGTGAGSGWLLGNRLAKE
jgi:phytoene dehydrogenase-like protein